MWQASNHEHEELRSYFMSAGFLNLQLVKRSQMLHNTYTVHGGNQQKASDARWMETANLSR